MIDRTFLGVLTFGLLIAGTLLIGSALFESNSAPSPGARTTARVAQLEPVVIVAKRAAPTAVAGANAGEARATALQ